MYIVCFNDTFTNNGGGFNPQQEKKSIYTHIQETNIFKSLVKEHSDTLSAY